MPANIVWIPMSNVPMNGDYTGTIQVGSTNQPLVVTLDTGSSTLALAENTYNPANDASMNVTDNVQSVYYGTGATFWYGAVVETTVTIGSGASSLQIPACNVAVAAQESADMFRNTQGILGLAYVELNDAQQMSGPTWPLRYSAKAIARLGKDITIDPFFTQLTKENGVASMFAFYSLRSWPNLVLADPTQDPMNQGWLILGGGPENVNLFTGEFMLAKVVGESWYDTNLKQIIVGNQPPIAVAPAPSTPVGQPTLSNSIVDSGTNALLLVDPYFTSVINAFNAVDPSFGALIKAAGTQADGSQGTVANNQVNVANWPVLQFVLEGDAADVVLSVSPSTYWQSDALQQGQSTFTIGLWPRIPSILGLPLLNNYYTVFDQTGTGTLQFAQIAAPKNGVLPRPGPA